MPGSLSALLSGKIGSGRGSYLGGYSRNGLPSSSSSGSINPKDNNNQLVKSSSSSQAQKERETAMFAAMASQTLFKKLGGAFWDAFSGSSSTPGNATSVVAKSWDAEKVRKVLEGKAVVKVVDVEPSSPPLSSPPTISDSSSSKLGACSSRDCVTDLGDSLKKLSLGKK